VELGDHFPAESAAESSTDGPTGLDSDGWRHAGPTDEEETRVVQITAEVVLKAESAGEGEASWQPCQIEIVLPRQLKVLATELTRSPYFGIPLEPSPPSPPTTFAAAAAAGTSLGVSPNGAAAATATDTWSCHACTFLNTNLTSPACEMCGTAQSNITVLTNADQADRQLKSLRSTDQETRETREPHSEATEEKEGEAEQPIECNAIKSKTSFVKSERNLSKMTSSGEHLFTQMQVPPASTSPPTSTSQPASREAPPTILEATDPKPDDLTLPFSTDQPPPRSISAPALQPKPSFRHRLAKGLGFGKSSNLSASLSAGPSKPEAAELSPDPETQFKLVKKVGFGSYGAVHQAIVLKTGMLAAIKIIPMEDGYHEFAPAVQSEIDILKKCHHENIVTYYAAIPKGRKMWIAMEYCAAGSVAAMYQAHKSELAEVEIASIVYYSLSGAVRVFRQKLTLEDAIGSHACSLEANMRVTNDIPLGCLLLLPVGAVNSVQTLKTSTATQTATPYPNH
jgi:hypothetical protein